MKNRIIVILFLFSIILKIPVAANTYGLQRITINKANIYFETRTLYDILLFENFYLGYKKQINLFNIDVKTGYFFFVGKRLLKDQLSLDDISFNTNGLSLIAKATYSPNDKLIVGPIINYFNNFQSPDIRGGIYLQYALLNKLTVDNTTYFNISKKQVENLLFVKIKFGYFGISLGFYYPGFTMENLVDLPVLPYLDFYFEK